MIGPQHVPSPVTPVTSGPAPRKSPITSEQLQDWIVRRQRFRRRATVVSVSIMAVGICVFAVIWSLFHKHLIAKGRIEGYGFLVDWDINPANLSTGGTTSVSYRPNYNLRDDRLWAKDLVPLKDLAHVQLLAMSGLTWLTDDDLAVIADLNELEELDLDRMPSPDRLNNNLSPLTDRVLDHVKGLTRLKHLGLSSNRITDAGLAKLANLQALETLDLDGTLVSDAGLDRLVGLKALKTLRVEGTRVTAAGRARFQQKRPDVEVIHESAPMDPERSLR